MFDFLKLKGPKKPPANVAVIDLGTMTAKVANLDLTTFNPTLLGSGQISYPENTLLSGLVSNWEEFVKTVAAVLRQASITGGFTPAEVVYSLSGEFIKAITVELMVHRSRSGPVKEGEKKEIKKEIDRLLRLEIIKEYRRVTGATGDDFEIVEKNLVGLNSPRGVSLPDFESVFEQDFKATLTVSFISHQTAQLLKKLTADLKKDWTIACNQLVSVVDCLQRNQGEISALFLDYGDQVCDLAVISQGRVIGERTLPLGGRDLTQIVAENFRLPLAEAEIKKRQENVLSLAITNDYMNFFYRSLTAAWQDILGESKIPDWTVYFWGGASRGSWWSGALSSYLQKNPHSPLKNLKWQAVDDFPLEINLGNVLEKNSAFEPVFAVAGQLSQKYATR